MNASQGQVLQLGFIAVLSCDDVIDLEPRWVKRQRAADSIRNALRRARKLCGSDHRSRGLLTVWSAAKRGVPWIA
jgi:hypothetical protein